jgi:ABC-type multidrug transport system ATPase subunit
MKLTSSTKFLSIEPFVAELPDFTILTGLNGAGKTHLLRGIAEGKIKITHEDIELQPIRFVESNQLIPNQIPPITKQNLDAKIKSLYTKFSAQTTPRVAGRPQATLTELEKKIISQVAANAKKAVNNLEADDFYIYYPLEDDIETRDVFFQNFSVLFKRYQLKFDENEYKEYRTTTKGEKGLSFQSKAEFISLYGEYPWDLVNKILSEAHLDYHVDSPNDSHRDAPYDIKLINNVNGNKINFEGLSSGEKVLMSLAFALYNSNNDVKFPKVLLMDEPDASLHPSMSKQFLDVIQKVFVQEKGVKVIITTHSPSTVALASEESLYTVNKTGTRLQKSTKDSALKILTTGVPSFSVNYENRRQVFVESPNDVLFYERIYQRLSNLLISDVSLSFISSGESRTDKNGIKISNCDQVINIVETLRLAGNKFIWGIVDWDQKNSSTESIKVLGNGKRYSIENYLLDPILIVALLLREKIITRSEIGLESNQTYIDFKNLSEQNLQIIIDFFIAKLELDSGNNENVKLLNGINVQIPKSFLHHQGHDLEALILKKFPELNSLKKGKEDALKLEVITKIIDDIPEIISEDLVKVFLELQKI